jgi:hypothetical protein
VNRPSPIGPTWNQRRFPIWLTGILVCAGYVTGLFTYRNNWPPVSTYAHLKDPQPLGYFSDVTGKTVTPCPANDARTAVILALGQSNASNRSAGDEAHAKAPAAVNFFDGKCYVAEDPLLGSDGFGNSVWTLVSDTLTRERTFDHVVIAPLTIGATSIHDWAENHDLNRRLERVLADLTVNRLPPTFIAWFQGEQDNLDRTPADQYVARFETLYRRIRGQGVKAPMYVSITTLCQRPPDAALRSAQMRLHSVDGVRPGPDTDTLGYGYRWDGCHFTAEGRAAAAGLWTRALLQGRAGQK